MTTLDSAFGTTTPAFSYKGEMIATNCGSPENESSVIPEKLRRTFETRAVTHTSLPAAYFPDVMSAMDTVVGHCGVAT